MTLRIAIAVVGLALWAGAASAEHWNGGDGKLPKPIDSPIVRPKLRNVNKLKARVATNPYERIGWGPSGSSPITVRSLPHNLR
jgi:hypothetical protein